MSWLYVPASEALNSDSNLPNPALAQSVTWRGKPIRSLSHSPVFVTVFSTMHQSGLTSKPSTASPGVALWIASLAATRASHFPTQVVEKGKTTPDTCGPISSASSEKSGPGSAFLKTWLDTFRLVLNQYGETFETWVTRLRRDSLRRQKLGRRTNDSGSSSWPTARVSSGNGPSQAEIDAGDPNKRLETSAALWPTATDDSKRGGAADPAKRRAQGHTVNLQDEARGWMTPKAAQGGATAKTSGRPIEKSTHLQTQAHLWATPRVSSGNGPSQKELDLGDPKSRLETSAAMWLTPSMQDEAHAGPSTNQKSLKMQSRTWATPTSRDHKDGADPSANVETNSLLGRQAPRTPMPGQKFYASKRALNPRFVEWLMAFPIGWTALQPLETASYQQWQQQHGDNSERRLTGSR